MKVSVIVPAYKFVNYLEQSLLSTLWQKTNFEFEVLVRDDFSQDGSEEIIERLSTFYPNLKHFRATENLGFHKNIPFLLSQSKGEYIAYLDGDDYFFNEYKLQKQVDFLDSNPDYSMHCTG
jgi:glycosyltransferase involved in cell wall biosynthesis